MVFYVLDDLQPISDILVKEYKESVDVRKLKDKINRDKVDLSAKESKLKEKAKVKQKLKMKLKLIETPFRTREEVRS